MPLRDTRLLARTGLTSVVAEVYDATDALLQTTLMMEIGATGVYRADLPVATGNWAKLHDGVGNHAAIVRLGPSPADLLRLGFVRQGNTLIFTDAATGAEVARFAVPAGSETYTDNLMGYLAQDITLQLV